MGRARAQSCETGESGFTLVEIMVAITLLLIGVLGVVTMVDAANTSATKTNGRQNATNLMRRVIETGRAVPFLNLKTAGLAATLQAQSPDLADSTPSDSAWTVQRSGFTYTLTASVCLVDDAADGYGAHDVSDPVWCGDSSQTGSDDDQSHDYKRVNVTATWTSKGQPLSMSQAGLIPSAGHGDLPSTTSVDPTTPVPVTTRSTSSIGFRVTAVNSPVSLSWLVNGQTLGSCPPTSSSCSGSGAAWTFAWPLGTPVVDTAAGSVNNGLCIAGSYVYDGTYAVSARGYTANGLTGDAATQRVTIDRCLPIPPPNFLASGGKQAAVVDVEWTNNPEDDVKQYQVFRGSSLPPATPVCTVRRPATSCVDQSPPNYGGGPFYYGVYGYDVAANGSYRRGALSYVNVNVNNKAPNPPADPVFSRLNSDGTVSLWWFVPNPEDLDAGDQIESFRVYRRSAAATAATPAIGDRYDYDAIDSYCANANSGALCTFKDTNTGGAAHVYNVSSVDNHLRESSPTTNVTR